MTSTFVPPTATDDGHAEALSHALGEPRHVAAWTVVIGLVAAVVVDWMAIAGADLGPLEGG